MPLVSSWESRSDPKVPPASRVEDIATFFASPRSFDGHVGHLLSLDEMTVPERTAREKLLHDLTRLRTEALDAAGISWPRATITSPAQEIAESLNSGPYRFEPGQSITIVCAQLPEDMLRRMPYTDPPNPDFMELYRYSDLDSLLELLAICGPPIPPAVSSSALQIDCRRMTTQAIWSCWAGWTGTMPRVGP